MGCAPSGTSCKSGGLRLMTSSLVFSKEQLEVLNAFMRKSVEQDLSSKCPDITRIEAAVERLVQRLIGGVGNLDRRFSSMFLVSLNEHRRIKQLRFEYLLRIDALSTPTINSEVDTAITVDEDTNVPGFVRLQIRAPDADNWSEFLGSDGKLRRDLIKAKITSLLTMATKQDALNDADERFCLSPGQVVDAEVLMKILRQPDHCRVFYGAASSESTLPDPSNHRIVLVEDESGIILKIGLDGFKSKDVEVRLVIGASVSSWPTTADYPRRIPLHHCDVLLHYTAAQSGMYAVASGPHPGVRYDDRSSLWRIRVPAAETIMRQHYSDESVPALTEFVLLEILDQLRGRRSMNFPMKRKEYLRLVSRHILRTIHWWTLERVGPDPLRNWAPDTLSLHVLVVLDELARALKCQNLRCYFQPRCNVMLQCARGGTLHHEDTYVSDARIIEAYLTSLHAHCSSGLNFEATISTGDLLENELIARWRRVMTSLPRGTMSGYYGYSVRQLQYLGLVVKEVLRAKDALLQRNSENFGSILNFSGLSHIGEPTENLVYLLSLTLKQARDQIYTHADRRRRKKRHQRGRSRAERRHSCARTYFDRSVSLLIDIVGSDRETAYLDLDNYVILAKTLLKWLYFGMDHDRKIIGPILRPYLGNLFNSSHENAWHVESWKKRQEFYNSEMRSLGLFCKLVTAREISPANGIVDSLSKGWYWAENITKMIERSDNSLKLIFLTSDRILRYNLTFTNNKGLSSFSSWSKARNIGNAVRRANIARTTLITAADCLPGLYEATGGDVNTEIAGHVDLRDASPLTFVVSMSRRRGRQRGPGGLIPALVTLNKFTVLQEVAQVLPQDEKNAMLDLIQRISREASRRLRRASCPDPSTSGIPRQTYTPRSESNLYETPEKYSPTTCQHPVILEIKKQLHREILEVQDTLMRGLRDRADIPAWDSTSMASWASSAGSTTRGRLKKTYPSVWDTIRGTSPMWDSVSCDGSLFGTAKSQQIINRMGSPKRTLSKATSTTNTISDVYDIDNKLPSWEILETTLNRKLLKYDNVRPEIYDVNKDVSVDYLVMSNDRKEFPRRKMAK